MIASMSGQFIPSDRPKKNPRPNSEEKEDESGGSSDGESQEEDGDSEEQFLEILTEDQKDDMDKFKTYLLEAHEIDKKYAMNVRGAAIEIELNQIWKTIDSFDNDTQRNLQEMTMMKDIQDMLLKKARQVKSNSNTQKIVKIFQNYKETFQRLQKKRYGMISEFVLQAELDVFSDCKTLVSRFVNKHNSEINWYKANEMLDERNYSNDIQKVVLSLRRNSDTTLALAKAVGPTLIEKSFKMLPHMNIASMRAIRKRRMDSIFFLINELSKDRTQMQIDKIGQPMAPVDIFNIDRDEHGNFILKTIGKNKVLSYKIDKEDLQLEPTGKIKGSKNENDKIKTHEVMVFVFFISYVIPCYRSIRHSQRKRKRSST